jgi:hypothetical protein
VPARRAWLLAALAVAAALRLAFLVRPRLWHDEATVGVMGLAVLRGELPVYFFGQPFMGALDAYLAAPLYQLLGVSAATLELTAALLSLAWLGLVVALAAQGFGPRAAAWTAVLLAVPGDFLLRWSHEARTHYPLGMALGTLALLLAWRAPEGGRRAPLRFALAGVVAGLAVWTTFLSLVFGPPVLLLLLRGGRGPLVRGAPWAAVGFALGSAPHWLYGVPHGTALPSGGGRLPLATLAAHLGDFAAVAWPVVAGVPGPLAARAAGLAVAAALGAAHGAALIAAARAVARGPAGPRWLAAAAGLLAAVNLAAAIGTPYGKNLRDYDQRYLLPLYTALPLLAGAGLQGLPALPAAVVGGALLAGQAAGVATGALRELAPAAVRAAAREARVQRETIEALAAAGLTRLYAPDASARILTFLADERVVFSQHYEEVVPRYARLVDGAPGAGWWLDRRSPVLEANLAALGVRGTFRRMSPLGGAYTAFTVDGRPAVLLDPGTLRATASEGGEAAAAVLDGDAATLWGTAGPRRGGEWVQLDLGAATRVALVRWLPGRYQEVPGGLALDLSPDGAAWTRAIDLPEYVGPLYWSADRPLARVRSGRGELRPAAGPARFIRLTQRGASPRWRWTVRELRVYAEAPAAAPVAAGPAGPAADGPALAAALREAGVRRLAADHGWAARVAAAAPEIRVPPANLYLDPYGFPGRSRDLLPPLRWEPGAALLVEPADAGAAARLLGEAGHAVSRRPLGPLALLAWAPPPALPGRPVPAADLAVSASRQGGRAALMLDGDPATRWATGGPQAPGDWVRIDLPAPRRVRGVLLASPGTADHPRGVAVECSPDGVRWVAVPAAASRRGPLRWGGFTPLRDGVDAVWLDLGATTARALRLVLTRGHPVVDWSIHELTVRAE